MFLAGCHIAPTTPAAPAAPAATQSARQGDEIIVAGQPFHTGTRIITWIDPGGYNGYQGAQRPDPRERLRVGEQDLAALQRAVDQFVLHYDGCGLSRICFKTLQDRGLSVHFLLDLDGTIYQTLDLRERALHATIANDRSIGIEMANLGAYPAGDTKELELWYRRDARGQTYIKVPAAAGDPRFHREHFTARPARPNPIRGVVQGKELIQYDFTPEQYAALGKLTATLGVLFPAIGANYPHDAAGRLILAKLPDDVLAKYRGILGHYHIQTNKVDPGPALQWDRLIDEVRQLAR